MATGHCASGSNRCLRRMSNPKRCWPHKPQLRGPQSNSILPMRRTKRWARRWVVTSCWNVWAKGGAAWSMSRGRLSQFGGAWR